MKTLHIAQLAPLWIPVPPRTYGGTELMVYNLTEELIRRNFDVTLFASGDSHTKAKLISTVEKAIWLKRGIKSPHAAIIRMIQAVHQRFSQFDLIHNHFNFFMLPLSLFENCPPFLSTVHRPIDTEYAETMKAYPKARFVAISKDHKKSMEEQEIPVHEVVYNGVDLKKYPFKIESGDYLLYLSRLNPEKGVLVAIEVAKTLKMKLIIAGNSAGNEEGDFFLHTLQPLLDNEYTQFRGQVNFEEKIDLLKHARVLLFPIERREPFGLVMIEAMACGTPVIAFRKGSAPEIVENEKTGFIVDTKEEMIEAVKHLSSIDRNACRKDMEERFSLQQMVDSYQHMYEKIVA